MKRTIIILTLTLFSLSTLVMPYANFDDTRSLQAVYNHCLKEDADMNFAEFIGEKLLAGSFSEGEEDETENTTHHPLQPVHGATIVEIQSGVLYQQHAIEIDLGQLQIISFSIPLMNTVILSNDFQPGIFHPPAVC